MKTILITSLKAIAIWVTILMSSILASYLIPLTIGVGSDGPLTAGEAFLLVNALHALILTVIGYYSKVRGLALAAVMSITLFSAQSLLLIMEAFYFIDDLKISSADLVGGCLQALIVSLFVGAISALLWRATSVLADTTGAIHNIPIKIAATALLYVLAYFLAGSYIAWSSNDVQSYYSFGEDIRLTPLLLFQALRGILWGLLAWLLVRSLAGSVAEKSFLVASTFSILATAQLLYPSVFMPWNVRLVHMIEVGISNFIFGGLSVLVLHYGNGISNQVRSSNIRKV